MHDSPSFWTSRWHFVLAATGAAVGLGNIWKFPYMVGSHGGSAFVLVYLICVFLMGMPLMMAEMLIGKLGQRSVVGSLKVLSKAHRLDPRWSWLGWWGALTLLLVLSFYAVVSGWSLYYLWAVVSGQLTDPDSLTHVWDHLIQTPSLLISYQLSFLVMTVWVVARGVHQGLERASRAMMPGLLVILVALVGYAASTSGFKQAFVFLFHFDASQLNAEVMISAMGHAFFTLAVGAGCLLSYGAYLPQKTPIASSVGIIAALDVGVAFLSGMAIYPLIFTYHLSPTSGPGLMFQVLPMAFAHMGGGAWFGCLFFTLLLFAAWTSSISLAEPLAMLVVERSVLNRRGACVIIFLLAGSIGILAALSFNCLSGFHPLPGYTLFTALTDLCTNILLPLGALGFAAYAAWFLPRRLCAEALLWQPLSLRYRCWSLATRWAVPLGVGTLLLSHWLF